MDVTHHEVRVFCAMRSHPERWWSNHDVAGVVQPDVTYRTVRKHTERLAHQGVLRRARVAQGFRYRVIPAENCQNRDYLRRLEQAAAVFNV